MMRSTFTGTLFFFMLYSSFVQSRIPPTNSATEQHCFSGSQTGHAKHRFASLLDVYYMALQNNSSLASARATFKAEREVVPQARAPLLPQLNVNTNTSYNKNTFPDKTANNKSHWNTHAWSASVNQVVFDLSCMLNLKAAYTKKHIARLTLEKAEQKLIYDVASSYFAVLKEQDDKSSVAAHLRAVKKQLAQTEERYKVGMVANTDVQEAKAAYDTAKVGVIQIENAIIVAKENLSLLTNMPVPGLYKLNQKMPANAPEPNQLSTWEKWAVMYNLIVQQTRHDVSLSQYELKAARAAFLPTVSSSVSFGHTVNNATAARLGNQRKSDGLTATLNISMPLFSGGNDYSKSKAASYALEAKQKTEDAVVHQAKIDVHNYYNTVNADVSQIKAWCQSIVSAASSLKATQSGYQVGTRTIIDVLNSQDTLYNAQKQYLDSRYNFILNTLKLKQASGTLSSKDLQYLNQWMVPPDNSSDPLTPYCLTTKDSLHKR